MYFPYKFCCTCLCDKSDLKPIFDVDSDGVSRYNKLTSSVVEMNFEEMNNQRLICEGCCVTLNTVYDFQQMCLRNKIKLITYISQLQTSSHVSGTAKDKKEIEIKCENEEIGNSFGDISDSQCPLQIKSDPDDISSVSNKFCCACLCYKSDLKHMSDVDSDGVSHYNKMASSIAGMGFEEMYNQRLICVECCVILNTVYAFRQACLRSKANLVTYISQPRTSGQVGGLRTDCPKTVTQDIQIKEEIDTTCDIEDSGINFEDKSIARNSNPNDQSDVCSVSIKQECESDEESNVPCKVEADDRANGSERTDVKIEDVGDETRVEDEYTGNFVYLKVENATGDSNNEMDIEGDPLVDAKKVEPSDTREKRSYACELCDKKFKEKRYLLPHMRIHTGEKPYECAICNKRFIQRTSLKVHTQWHTGENPVAYDCEICEKRFYAKHSYKEHQLTHSGEKPYECGVCKRRFNRKRNLNTHMITHAGRKPFECVLCSKRFTRTNDLFVHMRTHSRVKHFECEVCKKGFTVQHSLTRHMKSHEAASAHSCNLCQEKFSRSEKLVAHMRVHSGERPYECELCKKGFHRKRILSAHMVTHAGKKPFECAVCEKKFARKNGLLLHARTHSETKHFECEICRKGFTVQYSLTRHMKSHVVNADVHG